MFLRTATARCSTSAMARAPSSMARRCLLARAMLSGEGSADFLPAIVTPICNKPIFNKVKPAQSWDRAGGAATPVHP